MNNFTPGAVKAVTESSREATRMGCAYVGTEHLVLGILKNPECVAAGALVRMDVDLVELRKDIEERAEKGAKKPSGPIPQTPRFKKALALAGQEAKKLKSNVVGTEHLLLGILRDDSGIAVGVLNAFEVHYQNAKAELMAMLDLDEEEEADSNLLEPGQKPKPGGSTKTKALDAFGRDLTEMAKKGEIDPVIGRADEIERVIQILCRRTKNNPVLIGEAGVGKTAIAEGLAMEVVQGRVPELLLNKRIITLDLALMVAGTQYRGQFEQRLKAVMDEVKRGKNVILFIDEMHTMVGAGAASGSMDASNILKPALSRGELQCIGATTLNEYRKYIEKDAALERRFQQVQVEAPSVDETILILKGIRSKYEAHHKAKILDIAIETAAKLSDRYLTGRFLPDKAIDVIDEAGSRARIAARAKPAIIRELEAAVQIVAADKDAAIKLQNYEAAAVLRDTEKEERSRIDRLISEWRAKKDEVEVVVGEEDVMAVLSKWTGIPLSRMEQKEVVRVLAMEAEIQCKVIGQNPAVTAISKALRRSKADLKDPRRPIGTFLFLGPTGVGKTYLARTLAEFMFGDADSLIQIDMSEYMEKFSVSRLIGAPPGYIGYEEGGQLSEAVRRKPYSVVLFDEVEKAHPDAMNILLQILEEGRITDSLGRKIDFRNTIIILTSNVGSDVMKKQASMGFGVQTSGSAHESMRGRVMEEAKRAFKPEFLNRLDDMIVFSSLGKDELTRIVKIEIENVSKRVQAKDVTITLDDSAMELLVENGYDPTYGARPMRRAVERFLEDPIAEELLRGSIAAGDKVLVSRNGAKMKFETAAKSQKRTKVSE